MKKIDIMKLDDIKILLNDVENEKPLMIQEGKEEKYVVITMEDYERFMHLYHEDVERHPLKYAKPQEIHIVANPAEEFNISEEEYEDIKKQLLDAIEKTFKPKTNKMN